MRSRVALSTRAGAAIVGVAVAALASLSTVVPTGAGSRNGAGVDQVERIHPVASVNLGYLATHLSDQAPARHLEIEHPLPHHGLNSAAGELPRLPSGGAGAPQSSVVSGGQASAFNGISSIDMETGGTGNYSGTNLNLEPPDQGLCTGGGFVIESVNDSLRVYSTGGVAMTQKSIPLSQFFQRAAGGLTGPTDFISDPRCIFDDATQRWFVTILDLTSVPAYPDFEDDQDFIAVSRTSNPMGDWTILAFDVTDNGLHGSPLHVGCVAGAAGAATVAGCLGDQPTLGADANGIYVTDNEYAFAEVFPVAPPVAPPLQQVPVLRTGVAQLYALSKAQLVSGQDTTLVRFDSNTITFPGPAEDSPWQSISPAKPVPHDATPEPAGGVEYLMSDVGLPVNENANQVVVWAWTNTSALNGSNPNLTLLHTTVNTTSANDTFFMPDPSPNTTTLNGAAFYAYQKDGPHPLAAGSGDPEEVLNANDDRMNWVTEVDGTLWANVNTQLPATSPGAPGDAGLPRVGIMYFHVKPTVSGSTLSATMLRDGYLSVPDANVLFGSIGPRVDGAVVMTFTLAGIDYFPSIAWARLDGLAAGQAPQVHVALAGRAPEDGFTGLGLLGSQGIGLPDVPPCGPCVARWGDYSAAQVDDAGCIWGAAEYIPTGVHDNFGVTDWGTGITRECPAIIASVAPATPTPAPTLPPVVASGAPNTSAAGASASPALLALAGLAAGVVMLSALRRRRVRRSGEGD